MEGIRTSTGNETVDRLSRMNITGNIIPAAWYQTIRKPTGKPYLNAIVILSDIVYWYRAAEVRDEGSGQLLGYRKRFKADLLQRSYQQMADQFGITKRDATNAVVELERLGVVRRVFRTLTINGQTVPNILFLELDADVLEQITFPEECVTKQEPEAKKEENRKNFGVESGAGMVYRGYHSNRGHLPPESERGITENGDTSPWDEREGPTEMGETNTANTYRDYNTDYPIESYQQTKGAFKRQIDLPDSIRLRDFDICGARHIFHKSDAERLNQTTVLYQAENTGELAGDFIQSPVYMVSGMVKKILDMYEDDLVFKKVSLINKEKGTEILYYQVLMDEIEALSESVERYPDQTEKKIILSPNKIGEHKVFMLADSRMKDPIVNLDIIESLLKRNPIGIRFQEIEVEKNG